MKTNEVIKQYHVTRKALLVYEEKGFLKPERDQSDYRNYRDEDLKVLNKIMLLRRLNISLDDIEQILSGNHDWIDKTNKEYDLEIKRLKTKQSYLDYVNHVINDDYDINEAIASLDESIKYEEVNETKPFKMEVMLIIVNIIFGILISTNTNNIFMTFTMFIVALSTFLIAYLDSKGNSLSDINRNLISLGNLSIGLLGIYCYLSQSYSNVYDLLLIYSLLIIIYTLSKHDKIKRILTPNSVTELNVFICFSASLFVSVKMLEGFGIIVLNHKIIYFICSIGIVLTLVGTLIKNKYFKGE